jgi:ferredoxin
MVHAMGKGKMKVSIRYFSGTGNSWRIATACAERFRAAGFETDVASILSGNPPNPLADAVCFCFPVYALDLPRIASAYLRGLPAPAKQTGSILLVTGGDPDNCGWAVESGTRILSDRGYQMRIGELIHMPNNWTPFHSAPEPGEAERIITRGIQSAEDIVSRFLAGESWIKPIVLRKFGPVGSILMRTLFHRRGVEKMWGFFRVDERCRGCGLCARSCPTGSIRMQAGKPVWGATCEQCMRCFNLCPNRAIQQLEPILHGSRHRVYHLPGFNPQMETKQADSRRRMNSPGTANTGVSP